MRSYRCRTRRSNSRRIVETRRQVRAAGAFSQGRCLLLHWNVTTALPSIDKICIGRPRTLRSANKGTRVMRTPRIAIVGGGVGGLAAALALERRGAEVIVLEQSPALNEIGAGLNLSPHALVALRVLAVEDAIIALGSESDFLIIRSWKSGRVISRMRRGAFRQQFGAPNLTVHRADLLDVLRGALKTVDFRLGARCIAAEECDRGGVVRLADGGEIEADIIVGADGIHSVVRKSLFGPDAPRFTGCICWRGMATASAVPRDIAIAEGAMWMGPHGHVV